MLSAHFFCKRNFVRTVIAFLAQLIVYTRFGIIWPEIKKNYTRKGACVVDKSEFDPKGYSLSAFVKKHRREQGWTQIQLAEYAGVGLRFVRELEQGKSSLRLDKVNQVLDLFSSCMGPVPIDRSVYADS